MSTSKKPTQTQQISSFDSPYVSLDLVSYMKSDQIMPFHVFNHSVLPDFLRQLSRGRAHLGGSDGGGGGDDSPHQLFEKIKGDMAHIRNACRRLESWERDVSGEINQLVLQCLDDAYRETMEANADPAICRDKLLRIRDRVSELKKHIYGPLKFVLNKNSESFKLSILSLTRLRGGEAKEGASQLADANSGREVGERNMADIRADYDGLSDAAKSCLLCFSVFPENEVIKKKVLAHWWIGEGFIGDGDDATTASDLFGEFTRKGLIKPVHKKRRPSADSFRMDPSVRYAVIKLAESAEFAKFDEATTRPTASSSGSPRPCLVRSNAREQPGSSARGFARGYASKQENVRTLFNVSEVRLEFNRSWFSKMKNARVLQLGKWQSSGADSEHIVEVDSSDFLKGLKRMKHLRYLSLRGVSGIDELPSSVCKLSSLRILNLNGCPDLQRLPEGIGSLKKLTHLDMYECYFISHMPKGISQLTELQTLKGFVIGKARPGFEGKHCQLEDLTKLKKLRKLNIHVDRKLGNAKNELSCLEKFENLESLSVSWSRIYYSSGGPKGMQRVISQVKRMASFPGSPRVAKSSPRVAKSSPTGSIASPSTKLPEKLKKLDLHYFPSEKISKWFSMEKMQGLKKLYVRGGDLLSDLSEESNCWKTVGILRVKFLKNLAMDWGELIKLFPNLVYLEKLECPKLRSFPCDDSEIWEKE